VKPRKTWQAVTSSRMCAFGDVMLRICANMRCRWQCGDVRLRRCDASHMCKYEILEKFVTCNDCNDCNERKYEIRDTKYEIRKTKCERGVRR